MACLEKYFSRGKQSSKLFRCFARIVVNIDRKKLKLAGSEFVGKRGGPSMDDGRRSKSASSQAPFWVKFL